LTKTNGFNFRRTKFLVLDEADMLLSGEYENDLENILSQIPRKDRKTYLFSATMTKNVEKIEKAQLNDPVKLMITSKKYDTVSSVNFFF
jgi:ATP-dependent RNA helicase DDX47/RRP3